MHLEYKILIFYHDIWQFAFSFDIRHAIQLYNLKIYIYNSNVILG